MGESNNDFYLPEFEDSSIDKPSKAVSLKNQGELPVFDEKKTSNDLEVPRPPPELKSKPIRVKLQDIEDKYLQEAASDEDMENAKTELKRKKNPVFINLQDYGHVISAIKSAKTNIKNLNLIFQKIDSINEAANTDVDNAFKNLEAIQRKLITLDNHLFEGMEE